MTTLAATTIQTPDFNDGRCADHGLMMAAGSAVSGILESQGCWAADWKRVRIHAASDLSLIHNVRFYGDVSIGLLSGNSDGDETYGQGIFNAVLRDCSIGSGCYISNVRGSLRGCSIGNNVVIEDVGSISFESADAPCGVGTAVGVLDETGSRPVYIYPGLDAQLAALMAWKPRWTDNILFPLLQEMWDNMPSFARIGDGAVIRGVGSMTDVGVGGGVTVEGAARLTNGLIINNSPTSRSFAYVGAGVDAENFIIEDGKVMAGALLRNCYVGQGAIIDKGFTAHDSLFFANCNCENGEACALFAGPYTVSMHKSSLLIGTMTSFMNAGSGTNSSNHKYKLGPVHWGLMERGVKTASDSYVMWGGRIGAFSLLMGSHKKHPDTSDFPFSYLFSTPDGGTLVVPGVMLRSCGLARDAVKWPSRDNRRKPRLPLHDRVRFDVLNPITVGMMIHSISIIDSLLAAGPDNNGQYTFKGLKFTGSGLEKGRGYYRMAVLKYLADKPADTSQAVDAPETWVDLGGLPLPRHVVEDVRNCDSIDDMRSILDNAYERYDEMTAAWKASVLRDEKWQAAMSEAKAAAEKLEQMIEADRNTTLQTMAEHAAFLRK